MTASLFNSDLANNIFANKDVLSVFKQPEKTMIIREGMSVSEISDVVSDKLIAVVKEQFRATEKQFQVPPLAKQ